MPNVPLNMEYYDCTKEAGRKAIDERLNEIQLPVSNTPAVPPPADVNAFCRDMEEQSNANNILKQALKPKPSAPKQPAAKKRKNKQTNKQNVNGKPAGLFLPEGPAPFAHTPLLSKRP